MRQQQSQKPSQSSCQRQRNGSPWQTIGWIFWSSIWWFPWVIWYQWKLLLPFLLVGVICLIGYSLWKAKNDSLKRQPMVVLRTPIYEQEYQPPAYERGYQEHKPAPSRDMPVYKPPISRATEWDEEQPQAQYPMQEPPRT